MDDIHKIKECLRELAGFAPIETEVAKVISVDGAACKVSRVRDGMAIDKVRLNAITTSDKGVVVVPKTGTYVLVSRMGDNGWFVSQCGEAERITIDAETEIVINGGGNHGLVKVEKMVGWMQKVYNDLQTLTGLLSSSPVAGNGAPLAITFTPTTPSPSIDDFQNKDITH